MLFWILTVLTILLLIIALTAKSRKRFKLTLFLLIVFSGAVLVIYNSFSNNGLSNLDFISSFFLKSNIDFVNNEIFASTEDESTSGWQSFNSHLADFRKGNNSFIIIPRSESMWQTKSEGPMIYRSAEGDFLFSSLVRTRKLSDTIKFPESDLQFGGIIIRDPASIGSDENYVMIAVGYKENELKLEAKSTTNGASSVSSFPWPSGDAELMIQSESGVFGIYARPYGIEGEWVRIQTYYRPDLPEYLQAGLIAYSYSYGGNQQNLISYFDDVQIRKQDE